MLSALAEKADRSLPSLRIIQGPPTACGRSDIRFRPLC
jgi:hypothetical protein